MRSTTELRTAEFLVPGMGSDHCAGLISTSLRRLSGVESVRTNSAAHTVVVHFAPQRVSVQQLEAAIEQAGMWPSGRSRSARRRRARCG
jgi:P-type Cu+ transporter